MDEPTFLTLAEVLELHDRSIQQFGGSPGVRDRGLLESALATPQATFGGQYLHDGLAEMAAAYLFHLVKNHPFVDGNKRTGALSARVFVRMNGARFAPTEDEYGDHVLAVASGKADKDECVAFFKAHVKG